jgi:hypothetical protein
MGDSPLRDAIEALPGSLTSNTVLAAQTDPFRLDTPANHRDSRWLADAMNEHDIDTIHNRGLHYALLTRPKPDGTPYGTGDWDWLDRLSGIARWLGYIDFDRIEDHKHAEPVLRLWTPPGEPEPYVWVQSDFRATVPGADDLEVLPGVLGFTGSQPYHLALIGEKSSLEPVLGPIASSYQADLFLPTGDISNTMVWRLARAAAEDGRPLVVLYFSDCDPSGWNMPIVIHRKLQAFQIMHFPELEWRTIRAALTPDQVRRFGLPESPVTQADPRWEKWAQRQGVQQTEIDALATLQPDLLRQVAEEVIAPFFDTTLSARVSTALREWRREAQQALDEQTPEDLDELREVAADQLAELRDEMQQRVDEIIESVRVDPGDIELPELPEIPEADVDIDAQPEPLCDSQWSFAEQTQRLLASKRYEEDT